MINIVLSFIFLIISTPIYSHGDELGFEEAQEIIAQITSGHNKLNLRTISDQTHLDYQSNRFGHFEYQGTIIEFEKSKMLQLISSIIQEARNKTLDQEELEIINQLEHTLIEKFKSKAIHFLKTPYDFFKEIWTTIKRGRVWHGEIKNKAKDGGYYWVDTTIYPIKNESGKLEKFISIRFDITRRKNIEDELFNAYEKVRDAMEVKTRFLANMSHEIRTPLNSIIGLTEVLGETKLDEEQEQYLMSINDSGICLLQIVNDILDLSKIEAGQLDIEEIEFDLGLLLEQVVDMINIRAYEKDIYLILEIDADVPLLVYGDPLRLRQVLMNLIGNAIKFTEVGHVLVRVRLRSELVDDKANIIISVIDTGIGIRAEDLEHIFESFKQANKSITGKFGGTGLGLNIVKQLVLKMNGNVDVKSEYGKGSTFQLDLPMKFNPSSLIIKSSMRHILEGKKIILIDEYKMNRLVEKKLFESWGGKVEEAESTSVAINMIENNSFDFIILDSNLTEMNAFDLINQIRVTNQFVPIVVFCSLNDREQNEQIRNLDYVEYIHKPMKISDLKKSIRQVSNSTVRGNILLLDDDKDILNCLQDLFIPLDIEVLIAQNVEEAIRIYNDREIDVIISDVNLPDKSGMDFLKYVREKNFTIPFMLVTGFYDINKQSLADKYHAYFYEKPLDVSRLIKDVETFMRVSRNDKNKENLVDIEEYKYKNNLNILVVDDSKNNRNLIEVYFRKEDHRLTLVESGAEAIKKFKENNYDLILMDLQMPEMDGHEAVKIMREIEGSNHSNRTFIVALSANVLKDEIEKCFENGFDDYLSKPIKKTELLEYINNTFIKKSA